MIEQLERNFKNVILIEDEVKGYTNPLHEFAVTNVVCQNADQKTVLKYTNNLAITEGHIRPEILNMVNSADIEVMNITLNCVLMDIENTLDELEERGLYKAEQEGAYIINISDDNIFQDLTIMNKVNRILRTARTIGYSIIIISKDRVSKPELKNIIMDSILV